MSGNKKGKAKAPKTDYLMFCENENCNMPQRVSSFILKTYFSTEIPGVYCIHCNHLNPIPDYLRKIAGDL